MVRAAYTSTLWSVYEREANKLLREMLKNLSVLEARPRTRTAYASSLYTLYRCAHTLKSTSEDIGLPHVHQRAKALEQMLNQVQDKHGTLTPSQLSMVRTMLKQCKDKISVQASGAKTQRLPRSAGNNRSPVIARTAAQPKPSLRGGRKASTKQSRRGTRTKILLVEDSDYFAKKSTQLLQHAPDGTYAVRHVTTLRDGVQCITHEAFDLVLLDLKLPDSDGLETITDMVESGSDVPVVVLTGTQDESLGVQAIHAGAQDYIAKSDMSSQLLARSIRYAMERHHHLIEQLHQWERAAEERHRLESLANANTTRPMVPCGKLVKTYEQALRYFLTSDPDAPAEAAKTMSELCFTQGLGGSEIVQLHLAVVDSLAKGLAQDVARELIDRARLLMLGVLAHVVDMHQMRAQ